MDKAPSQQPGGDSSRPQFPPSSRPAEPVPDPIAGGEPARIESPGRWKPAVTKFLQARERERDAIREQWERDRKRRKCDDRLRDVPRPHLDATSNFGPQITALPVGAAGTISFTVWNEGLYPAWTCYVEVYEGPGGYTSPLSAYARRGRRIITLHPGERRDVALPWVRQLQTGRVVGLVFDPLLDPHGLEVVEQFNRHVTSVHYTNLA